MKRLIILLFLLTSGEVVSQSDKDFLVVKETLDLIWVSKNEIYFTTNLFKFLVDINNTLTLGFNVENELGKSLTITVGDKKMKLIEVPPSLTDVKNLCLLIQPQIEEKLKGFNLKYDYPEYISDYLMTTIDRGSWLMSTTFGNKNLTGLNFGIQCRKDSGNYFVIKTMIKDYLGDQAGLLLNDRIMQINGIPTRILGGGALLKELSKVRNEKVLLTIARNGSTIEVNLDNRTLITQNTSANSTAIIDNVVYVKIRKLNAIVFDKLRRLCSSPNKNELILDFRNCSGGELGAAFDIANIFVPKGDTIFKIKFANVQDNRSRALVATGENQLTTTKRIVILVNGQTASGAEVVVSALKFFKLAKVIGSKTYGNGEISDTRSIVSGVFRVKLTTGQLFGADGLMISDHGIEPDIKVDDSVDIIQFALSQLK